MKHVWSIICQRYLVDAKTNNLSLIDIYNRFGFTGNFPENRPLVLTLPNPIYLVSTWRRESNTDPQQCKALVKTISPNGEILGQFEIDFKFMNSDEHRTFGKVETLLYTYNGVYQIQVYVQDEEEPVASIPFEIIHEQPKFIGEGKINEPTA